MWNYLASGSGTESVDDEDSGTLAVAIENAHRMRIEHVDAQNGTEGKENMPPPESSVSNSPCSSSGEDGKGQPATPLKRLVVRPRWSPSPRVLGSQNVLYPVVAAPRSAAIGTGTKPTALLVPQQAQWGASVRLPKVLGFKPFFVKSATGTSGSGTKQVHQEEPLLFATSSEVKDSEEEDPTFAFAARTTSKYANATDSGIATKTTFAGSPASDSLSAEEQQRPSRSENRSVIFLDLEPHETYLQRVDEITGDVQEDEEHARVMVEVGVEQSSSTNSSSSANSINTVVTADELGSIPTLSPDSQPALPNVSMVRADSSFSTATAVPSFSVASAATIELPQGRKSGEIDLNVPFSSGALRATSSSSMPRTPGGRERSRFPAPTNVYNNRQGHLQKDLPKQLGGLSQAVSTAIADFRMQGQSSMTSVTPQLPPLSPSKPEGAPSTVQMTQRTSRTQSVDFLDTVASSRTFERSASVSGLSRQMSRPRSLTADQCASLTRRRSFKSEDKAATGDASSAFASPARGIVFANATGHSSVPFPVTGRSASSSSSSSTLLLPKSTSPSVTSAGRTKSLNDAAARDKQQPSWHAKQAAGDEKKCQVTRHQGVATAGATNGLFRNTLGGGPLLSRAGSASSFLATSSQFRMAPLEMRPFASTVPKNSITESEVTRKTIGESGPMLRRCSTSLLFAPIGDHVLKLPPPASSSAAGSCPDKVLSDDRPLLHPFAREGQHRTAAEIEDEDLLKRSNSDGALLLDEDLYSQTAGDERIPSLIADEEGDATSSSCHLPTSMLQAADGSVAKTSCGSACCGTHGSADAVADCDAQSGAEPSTHSRTCSASLSTASDAVVASSSSATSVSLPSCLHLSSHGSSSHLGALSMSSGPISLMQSIDDVHSSPRDSGTASASRRGASSSPSSDFVPREEKRYEVREACESDFESALSASVSGLQACKRFLLTRYREIRLPLHPALVQAASSSFEDPLGKLKFRSFLHRVELAELDIFDETIVETAPQEDGKDPSSATDGISAGPTDTVLTKADASTCGAEEAAGSTGGSSPVSPGTDKAANTLRQITGSAEGGGLRTRPEQLPDANAATSSSSGSCSAIATAAQQQRRAQMAKLQSHAVALYLLAGIELDMSVCFCAFPGLLAAIKVPECLWELVYRRIASQGIASKIVRKKSRVSATLLESVDELSCAEDALPPVEEDSLAFFDESALAPQVHHDGASSSGENQSKAVAYHESLLLAFSDFRTASTRPPPCGPPTRENTVGGEAENDEASVGSLLEDVAERLLEVEEESSSDEDCGETESDSLLRNSSKRQNSEAAKAPRIAEYYCASESQGGRRLRNPHQKKPSARRAERLAYVHGLPGVSEILRDVRAGRWKPLESPSQACTAMLQFDRDFFAAAVADVPEDQSETLKHEMAVRALRDISASTMSRLGKLGFGQNQSENTSLASSNGKATREEQTATKISLSDKQKEPPVLLVAVVQLMLGVPPPGVVIDQVLASLWAVLCNGSNIADGIGQDRPEGIQRCVRLPRAFLRILCRSVLELLRTHTRKFRTTSAVGAGPAVLNSCMGVFRNSLSMLLLVLSSSQLHGDPQFCASVLSEFSLLLAIPLRACEADHQTAPSSSLSFEGLFYLGESCSAPPVPQRARDAANQVWLGAEETVWNVVSPVAMDVRDFITYSVRTLKHRHPDADAGASGPSSPTLEDERRETSGVTEAASSSTERGSGIITGSSGEGTSGTLSGTSESSVSTSSATVEKAEARDEEDQLMRIVNNSARERLASFLRFVLLTPHGHHGLYWQHLVEFTVLEAHEAALRSGRREPDYVPPAVALIHGIAGAAARLLAQRFLRGFRSEEEDVFSDNCTRRGDDVLGEETVVASQLSCVWPTSEFLVSNKRRADAFRFWLCFVQKLEITLTKLVETVIISVFMALPLPQLQQQVGRDRNQDDPARQLAHEVRAHITPQEYNERWRTLGEVFAFPTPMRRFYPGHTEHPNPPPTLQPLQVLQTSMFQKVAREFQAKVLSALGRRTDEQCERLACHKVSKLHHTRESARQERLALLQMLQDSGGEGTLQTELVATDNFIHKVDEETSRLRTLEMEYLVSLARAQAIQETSSSSTTNI